MKPKPYEFKVEWQEYLPNAGWVPTQWITVKIRKEAEKKVSSLVEQRQPNGDRKFCGIRLVECYM